MIVDIGYIRQYFGGDYVFTIVLFDKLYSRIFDFKNEGHFDSNQLTFDRIFRLSEGSRGNCKDNP